MAFDKVMTGAELSSSLQSPSFLAPFSPVGPVSCPLEHICSSSPGISSVWWLHPQRRELCSRVMLRWLHGGKSLASWDVSAIPNNNDLTFT